MPKLKTVIICNRCEKPCASNQGFKLHLRLKHGITGTSDDELTQYIETKFEGTYAEVQKFKEKALENEELVSQKNPAPFFENPLVSHDLMGVINNFYEERGHSVINFSKFIPHMTKLGIIDEYNLSEIIEKALVRFFGEQYFTRLSEEEKLKLYTTSFMGGDKYELAFADGLGSKYENNSEPKVETVVAAPTPNKKSTPKTKKKVKTRRNLSKESSEFHTKALKRLGGISRQLLAKTTHRYFPGDKRKFGIKYKNMSAVIEAYDNVLNWKVEVEAQAQSININNGTPLVSARRIARQTIPLKELTKNV